MFRIEHMLAAFQFVDFLLHLRLSEFDTFSNMVLRLHIHQNIVQTKQHAAVQFDISYQIRAVLRLYN